MEPLKREGTPSGRPPFKNEEGSRTRSRRQSVEPRRVGVPAAVSDAPAVTPAESAACGFIAEARWRGRCVRLTNCTPTRRGEVLLAVPALASREASAAFHPTRRRRGATHRTRSGDDGPLDEALTAERGPAQRRSPADPESARGAPKARHRGGLSRSSPRARTGVALQKRRRPRLLGPRARSFKSGANAAGLASPRPWRERSSARRCT